MYSDTTNQLSLPQRGLAVEAAFDCTSEVFAGLERVVELNVQTVKTSLSEQLALTDATLSARSLTEVIELQSQQLPATITQTFAYWRHVGDIAVQTRSGFFGAMQDSFGTYLRSFTEAIDSAYAGAAKESSDQANVLVSGMNEVVSGVPVAIVDSTGKALSSDDVRGDLH